MTATNTAESDSQTTTNKSKPTWMFSLLFWFVGVSSWITVIGLFNELALMQNYIIEGYEIWSYITLIIQFGNIGPFIYAVIPQRFKSRKFVMICCYLVFIFNFLSTIIMSLFWDSPIYIFGSNRSLILYLTVFTTSICCGTTCIVFWIFVSYFPTQYIAVLAAGESSAGIMSSILIYIQQLNTNNNSPRYSVQIYLLCISAIFPISFIAFILLSKYLKNGYFDQATDVISNIDVNKNEEINERNSVIEDISTLISENSKITNMSKNYWRWYVLMGILNFVQNGMIPAISSYALLPYGQKTYLFSYTISNIMTPIACVLPAYLPTILVTKKFIVFSSFGWFMTSIYILIIAVYSPYSFGLKNGDTTTMKLICTVIIVIVSVIASCCLDICKTCMYLFVKKSFMTKTNSLDKATSEKALSRIMEIFGRAIQIGSFCGAVVFFLLINVGIFIGSTVSIGIGLLLLLYFIGKSHFCINHKNNDEKEIKKDCQIDIENNTPSSKSTNPKDSDNTVNMTVIQTE